MKKNETGQVIYEYVIMLGMFVLLSVFLIMVMSVYQEYGWRILKLVGLDYP